ncbi:MAG TPA: tetratricopeptide repeat protein [Candidatus Polarisedimenticolia bacterium]|nr:tetratricopeptide repeat protein [Candidatus Polarisedimenticolia bacterium]
MSRPVLSRPRARRLAAAALALAAALPARAATPPPDSGSLIRSGLKELHDGLYGKAEATFRSAARAAPDDPAPQMFIAFTYWWRTLEDRGDRSWDAPFLSAVESAVASGERLLEVDPRDRRVLVAVGTVHILRSQVEAMRKNLFKAGQEARRGKKKLEAALAVDPGYADALFGLGAYNYYTEKIPGLARGLLFMPRGDSELGLAQLKTLAASDAYFSADARLLLALICGHRDERCYGDAMAHLKEARRRNPDSPLVQGSMAGLEMRLGEYSSAVRDLDSALAAAAGPGKERLRQRRTLRVYLADALVSDWRLDRAEGILRTVGDPASLPPRERQVVERLRVELAFKRGDGAGGSAGGGPSLRSLVESALRAQDGKRDEEARRLLATAAGAFPQSPLPRFLSGRLEFLAGRYQEAEGSFQAALERAPSPPPWMSGWILLYRGLSEKALGRRLGARAHFQAASEVRHFRSIDRAWLELQEGVPPHGRCAP